MTNERKNEGTAGVPPAPSTLCRQDARAPFFNPFEDIAIHEHHLPHWQQGNAWQFITWRLADSLPASVLAAWTEEKEIWIRLHPQPWTTETETEYHQRFGARIDDWMDAGHGECLLRAQACSHIVATALRHFDGTRYALGPFVVMPNHVHVLFQSHPNWTLSDVVHSWKSFTAKEINRRLDRTGPVWQPEYWDRMIRHATHWHACRKYIVNNPAHLPPGNYELGEGTAGVPPAS
jgi:REP element-mobilizing transposase RayT